MNETLEPRFSALVSVPSEATDAYQAQGPRLIAAVDCALESRSDCAKLIGLNAIQTAFANHANHWRFMCNVFRLNNSDLLARVLPWVYRVYTARGFSLDYFPFVLQTYRQAVLDHLPPDCAEPIAAIYHVVEEQHELIATLAKTEDLSPPIEAIWLHRTEEFCEALLAADARKALALTQQWVKQTGDIPNFLQFVVTGTMIEIGRLWENNRINVAQEHLASAIVNRVMASLYPQIIDMTPRRGRAIVTCAPNEFHELGGRMFADLLELDGWDVMYLGANTPVEELVAMARSHNVSFLALSVAMPFNLEQAGRAISALRQLAPVRPKILLGGRAFSMSPRLWKDIGGDAYCPTAEAGVALARSWSGGQTA